MPQIYKIYMNESALILTHFQEILPFIGQDIDIQDFDLKSLFMQILEKDPQEVFILRTGDPKGLLKEIRTSVTFIKAAGGLVQNSNSEYLFIRRLGKWDIPKGKVEEGENMKETAVREVEEECGIEIDRLGKKIKSTYHVYTLHNKVVLKKTNWYKMTVNDNPILVPQEEEGISEAKWVAEKDVMQLCQNTYPLIRDLVEDQFSHLFRNKLP